MRPQLRIFWAMLIAISSFLLFPSVSSAQYVLSSAFCLNVVKNRCVEAVGNGGKVSVSQLKQANDGRRIYYWADVRAGSEAPIAFALLRDGPCYHETITYPEEKFREHPTTLSTLWAYVSNLSVGDVLNALDIEKVEGEAGLDGVTLVAAKLNAVIVPKSSSYRIYTYRLLSCSGSIRARLLDNNGEPLAGDNDTKALLLTE